MIVCKQRQKEPSPLERMPASRLDREAVGEIHTAVAPSRNRISPRGDQGTLVLWDRRHKTVLSGFMGISSTTSWSPFSSGEGFLRASVPIVCPFGCTLYGQLSGGLPHRSANLVMRSGINPFGTNLQKALSAGEGGPRSEFASGWWVRFILRMLRHQSGFLLHKQIICAIM